MDLEPIELRAFSRFLQGREIEVGLVILGSLKGGRPGPWRNATVSAFRQLGDH
jgi:hypothetical protein